MLKEVIPYLGTRIVLVSSCVLYMIEYVRNWKNYFYIASFLNFAGKCNITLNFRALDIPNWQKGGNLEIFFPVAYHIIFNPTSTYSYLFKKTR